MCIPTIDQTAMPLHQTFVGKQQIKAAKKKKNECSGTLSRQCFIRDQEYIKKKKKKGKE